MGLIKTSFYSAISTTISLVIKLITNKITAIYLGTNGMFILGQLKDFLNIGNISSNFGTTKGIIKYVAEYKDNTTKLRDFIGTSFKVHLFFAAVTCILTLIFKDFISEYLFGTTKYSGALILLAFSFISMSVHSLFMSILNGFKNIRLYVITSIIVSLISASIVVYMVINYNVIGAFYAIAIGQLIVVLISGTFLVSSQTIKFKTLLLPFKKKYFKKLSKFSLMAFAAPICLVSATLFIRFFLAEEFDENHAGSWEGMWRLSNMYILFLTTTFQFYLIPTFSNISGFALKKEIFKVWKLSIPIIILITISVYLLRDIIISFVFTKEFFLINSLILFHLLGDAFKINSWVLGNVLISKAKTKVFILFQIGWAIVFCSLSYILVKTYGFAGVSFAYFITYVIHFTVMNIYFRKLLWYKSS